MVTLREAVEAGDRFLFVQTADVLWRLPERKRKRGDLGFPGGRHQTGGAQVFPSGKLLLMFSFIFNVVGFLFLCLLAKMSFFPLPSRRAFPVRRRGRVSAAMSEAADRWSTSPVGGTSASSLSLRSLSRESELSKWNAEIRWVLWDPVMLRKSESSSCSPLGAEHPWACPLLSRSYCKNHAPSQSLSVDPNISLPQSCSVCLDSLDPVLSYSVLKCPSCHASWFHRDCVQVRAWPPARLGCVEANVMADFVLCVCC